MMYYTGWLSFISAVIALFGLFGITAMLWCVGDDIRSGIMSIFRRNLPGKTRTRIRTKKDKLGMVFLLVLFITGVCIAVYLGRKL